MVTTEKAKQVLSYYKKHGLEKTIIDCSVSLGTIERYERLVKNSHQEIINTISERYTDKELKTIANAGNYKKPKKVIKNYDGDVLTIGFSTDWHIGSEDFNENDVHTFYDVCKKEKVDHIFNAGDIIDGHHPTRHDQVFYQNIIGTDAQTEKAIEIIKQSPCEMSMISGNHDLYAFKSTGHDPIKRICEATGHNYLGQHEGYITINGIDMGLFHGNDRGASKWISQRGQTIADKLILAKHHPKFLFIGHDHKAGSFYHRGINIFAGGSIQKKTNFMRTNGLYADNVFYIIKITHKNNKILCVEQKRYIL